MTTKTLIHTSLRLGFDNKQGTKYDGHADIDINAYSDGTPHGAHVVLSLHGESNQSYTQGRRGSVQSLTPQEARDLAAELLAAANEAEALGGTSRE